MQIIALSFEISIFFFLVFFLSFLGKLQVRKSLLNRIKIRVKENLNNPQTCG